MNKNINTKKIVGYSALFAVVAILIVGFCLIAAYVFSAPLAGLDAYFQNLVISIRANWLTVIFKILTNLVNPIFVGLVSIIILLCAKKQRINAASMFVNLALAWVINFFLKSFFVRARPDLAFRLVTESGYSFPSGHAMVAVAFYGFLVYMVLRSNLKIWLKVCLSILFNVLILVVGFSRIYLGVHYATDVLGAYTFGFAYLIIFCFVVYIGTKHEKTAEKTLYKKHGFFAGFKYALSGIISAFKQEYNLLIQFSATMLVVVFGVSLKISGVEWCICISLCFLVMALELVNTAIENICDKITTQKDDKIKIIKDVSAGAVLTMSICAVIVALIIFIPKIQLLFI